MSTALEQKLIERIHREGSVTFRDFMQAALYDPELGYYNTERLKIGSEGDYYTTSNVHAAFGIGLAKAFAGLWINRPSLTILEIGAGTGQLAFDIISALRDEQPSIFEELNYVIVDQSPAMRKLQEDRLAIFGRRVQWHGMAELQLRTVAGIAFSNEFVDALPVHRIRFAGGAIQEQYVGATAVAEGNRLKLLWDKPSTDKLNEYVEQANVPPREGYIMEINLDAINWLTQMGHTLREGFLFTVDYGDSAQHLYVRERRGGTLRSFRNHQLVDSPLDRIGEQDITASVNFSALIEHGRRIGFEVVSYERQAAFLIRMGLIERIAAENSDESIDALKNRLSVKNLFTPGGLSDSFRVLIQEKRG